MSDTAQGLGTGPNIYRAICVDDVDPQKLGRVRVQVPMVLGSRASGWAFPAWGMDDLAVWPEDRIPKPGQGVWVQFEHPDRMTWIAAFGPQEFSNQRFDYILDPDTGLSIAYETSLTWDFAALPEAVAKPISGTLTSASGVPNPPPIEVILQKSPPGATRVWTDIATTEIDWYGSWSTTYARPVGEQDFWYRATFAGIDPFWPASTPETQISGTASVCALTPPEPVWKAPVTVTGVLVNALGAPLPSEPVKFQLSRDSGKAWTTHSTATTAPDGTWATTWTRSAADHIPLLSRAIFEGSATQDRDESPATAHPQVHVPITIQWTVPTPAYNTAFTITGTVSSTYGVPPGPLHFYTRSPSVTGNWTYRAITPNPSTGAFSTTHTQTSHTTEYCMVYPGALPFDYTETPYQARTVTTATTPSVPSIPTLYHGTTFSATGTIRDGIGNPVTSGTAVLEYYIETKGWRNASAVSAVASNGTYSLYTGPIGDVGYSAWRVHYLGGGGGYYLPSYGNYVEISIRLSAIGALSKGGVTHDACEFSWGGVSGATYYEVTQNNGGAYHYPTTGYFWIGGLNHMSEHSFRVRAIKQDILGNWVVGADSPTITCHTGRPESRWTSGIVGWEGRPYRTGSYRPDVGWGYIGDDIGQGYYSQTDRNYTGIMNYDGDGFRNWVAANWGWAVVDNLWFTSCNIAMYRKSGVGTGSAVSMWWYVSNALADTGGAPLLAGGEAHGSLAPGTSGWTGVPAHWAKHVLYHETVAGWRCDSLALHRANSSEYAQFEGSSGASNACNMSVGFRWDFVTSSYVAPRWY
jgi:Type VI secretion system/phage-baseplate injector OB domain